MDWNKDGKVDFHDYVHYKSLIDIDNSPNNNSSGSDISLDVAFGVKWLVGIVAVTVVLKLLGL